MTSERFDCLYYTDCRPGQGLRGGAGFQFQSVSTGVGHDAMTLIQRSALYEPPVSWMREQRPVADYPASLAHVFDGVYVTARGVYLGAEANGVREGNQFTHAVTTGDPATYGLIRPAQLWDAEWWSEQPAAGTECPPLDGQPERGPWGIDAVREWVLGQHDAETWLTAIVSAFDRVHGEQGRRVVFVAADPTPILGWIAAGTLLLPQSRALRLGFRVYTNNPQYSQHDVLGVHPDWAGQLADPNRSTSLIVFNVDNGRCSTVESTSAARFWVRRFLSADPFDVVDAVDLAHGFASRRVGRGGESDPDGITETDGDRLAAGVVLLDETVTEPEPAAALLDWLALHDEPVAEEILHTITMALLTVTTDVEALRTLDMVVQRHGASGELADHVRGLLLAADLAGLSAGRSDAMGRELPTHAWTPAGHDAAVRQIEAMAGVVGPELFDVVLRTAMRFGLRPNPAAFRDAAHRFVAWWVDHPDISVDPERWPNGQLMLDLLRDELRRRPDGAVTRAAVRQHLWRILLPVTGLDTALDVEVAAAAMVAGDTATRQAVLTNVLAITRNVHRPDGLAIAWQALFLDMEPDVDDILALLDCAHPGTAPGPVINQLATALAQSCRRQVGVRELTALERIDALGWSLPDNGLTGLRLQDRSLRRWLDTMPPSGDERAARDAQLLRGVTRAVLAARSTDICEAVLKAMSLAQVIRVVDNSGGETLEFLLNALFPHWQVIEPKAVDCDPVPVAIAFAVATARNTPDSVRRKYTERIRYWIDESPKESARRVWRELAAADADAGALWEQWTTAGLSPAHGNGRKETKETKQVKLGKGARVTKEGKAKRTRQEPLGQEEHARPWIVSRLLGPRRDGE